MATVIGDSIVYALTTADETLNTTESNVGLDTQVQIDTDTYSTSSGVITVKAAGTYLAINHFAVDRNTAGSNRTSGESFLHINASLVSGAYTDGYLRRSNSCDEFTDTAFGIYNLSTNDTVAMRKLRINNAGSDGRVVGSTTTYLPTKTALTLVKLNPDAAACILTGAAGDTSALTAQNTFVSQDWTTQTQIDAGFTHTPGTSDITIADAGTYIVGYSNSWSRDTDNTTREGVYERLRLDGVDIPGSFDNTYIRGSQSSEQITRGNNSAMTMIKTNDPDEVLSLVSSLELGTINCSRLPLKSQIFIYKVEATTDSFKIGSTSTETFTTTEATATYDGSLWADTGYTLASNQVTHPNTTKMLFMTGVETDGGGTRAIAFQKLRVAGTNSTYASGSGYCRNSAGMNKATPNVALIASVTATNLVEVRSVNTGSATAPRVASSGGFAGLDLNTLAAAGVTHEGIADLDGTATLGATSSPSVPASSSLSATATLAALSAVDVPASSVLASTATLNLAGTVDGVAGVAEDGYYIPDTRLSMPSLYYPKRKPVGKVKIDTEHTLSRDLEIVAMLNEKSQLRNLVNNRLVKETTNGVLSTVEHNSDGTHFNIATPADNEIDLQEVGRVRYVLGEDFTVSFKVRPDEGILISGQNNCFIQFQSSTTMRLTGAGAVTYTVVGATDLFGLHTYTFSAKDDVVSFYQDGRFLNSVAMTAGYIEFRWLFNYLTPETTFDFTGDLYYYYAHNRALSAAEARSLHDDPYQFLVPDVPPLRIIIPTVDADVAGYYIPDTRLSMPSLYYPNRKPTGNVEVDWNHPLAGKEVILVGNTAVTQRHKQVAALYGTSDQKAGRLSLGNNSALVFENHPNVLAGAIDFTLGFVCTIHAIDTWGGLFSRTNAARTANDIILQQNQSFDTFRLYVAGGGANITGSVTVALLTDGKEHVHLIVKKGTAFTWYMDGISIGTGTQLNAVPISAGGTTILGAERGGTTTNMQSDWSLAVIDDKAWTLEMVHSFTNSPYQSLRPVTPPLRIIIPTVDADVAGYYIPDTRLSIPALYYPKRKPVGNVMLDRTHPMVQGMVGYWFCNTAIPVNLVNGVRCTQTGTSVAFIERDKSVSNIFNGLDTHTPSPFIGIEDDYVWCIDVLTRTSNLTSCIFGNRYEGTSSPLQFFKIKVDAVEYYNAGTPSLNYPNVPNVRRQIVVAKVGDQISTYVDGVHTDTETVTKTMDANPVYIGNGRVNVLIETTDLDVYYAFHGRGKFTAERVLELYRDPYQFLRPVTPPIRIELPTVDAVLAGYYLPDRRLERPELYFPYRKPVGNVQIDWTNPLTRDLAFYGIATPAGLLDLVTGSLYRTGSAPSMDPVEIDRTLNGVAILSDPVDGREQWTIPTISANHGCTALIDHTLKSVGSGFQSKMFTLSDGVEGFPRMEINYGYEAAYLTTSFIYETGGSSYQSATPVTGEQSPTVFRHFETPGATDEAILTYIKGKEEYSQYKLNSFGGPIDITADYNTITLFGDYENITGTTFTIDANIYVIAFYSKDIGDAAAKVLSANPYQFLIPA